MGTAERLRDERTGQFRGSRAGAGGLPLAPSPAPLLFPSAPQAASPGIELPALDDTARVQGLRTLLKAEHPGLVLDLSGPDRGGFVTLSLISVPRTLRGTGVATAVMGRLTAEADRHGWTLALSPDSSFGSSKARLVGFYGRFGFTPNRGGTRDFATRETMIRRPSR
jgi:GNAT superfamily N-acetyltransferase